MARLQSRLSAKLTPAIAALLFGISLFSIGAHGQSADVEIVVPEKLQLPEGFVDNLLRQPDKNQRLLTAMQEYERIDLDGNGVSQADFDRNEQMKEARFRSNTVQRYLAYDLNADGIVTREERVNAVIWKNRRSASRRVSSASEKTWVKQRLQALLEPFEKADVNRDDQLDLYEVFGLAKHQAEAQMQSRSDRLRYTLESSIMSLDFNSDGVVSEAEFIAAISSLTPDAAKSQ